MLFYIVDDDEVTREMLSEIIEDEDLGVVSGESNDGSKLDNQLLALNKIDILLIDLLMPIKDGIETVSDINPFFKGKIVMISQMKSKELIAQAYSSGVTYYITKPLNKIEILSVIKNVIESIRLEASLHNIHHLTGDLLPDNPEIKNNSISVQDHIPHVQHLLSEVGIVGENGYRDLLDMLDYLFLHEEEMSFKDGLPHLKDVFLKVAQDKNKVTYSSEELKREIKASEQRVRRAIHQSLTYFASLGLNDFIDPTFENYASKFFDFEIVQKRMWEIKKKKTLPASQIRINTKKFIKVLYFETQRSMSDL